MNKSLRWSEKWFRMALWLVALVLAGFLTGLGSTIVGDLPKVESTRTPEQFLKRDEAAPLLQAAQLAQAKSRDAHSALQQAELQHEKAQADSSTAKDRFEAWRATRSATARPDQDAELMQRTRALEQLQLAERQALAEVQRQQQIALDASQAADRAEAALAPLRKQAQRAYEAEMRQVELRVFLYRLALTLPLLVVAGWLFARKRGSRWWPFVWGFILFALVAFFVELVPYLPSYGGYVRYSVGVIVTLLVGRYGILALSSYLERQRQAEALPDMQRRNELSYDTALARLGKGVCPGCERPVDLKDAAMDFCPHCGIGLFNRCSQCGTRKNAFARFCHACGAPAHADAAALGTAG